MPECQMQSKIKVALMEKCDLGKYCHKSESTIINHQRNSMFFFKTLKVELRLTSTRQNYVFCLHKITHTHRLQYL